MRTAEQRADIRRRYAAVDTSNVADVLDALGLPDQGLAPELAPMSGARLAGWAYTIAGQSRPYAGGGDPAKMDACAGIGPDEVAVWAGDGVGICYFGELIALGLRERGCVGSLRRCLSTECENAEHEGFVQASKGRMCLARSAEHTHASPKTSSSATCARWPCLRR